MRISDWSSDVCSSDLLLLDLGMHRAGIGGALRHRPCRLPFLAWPQIVLRRRPELLQATCRAEIIGGASIIVPILCGRGVDRNAADRIQRGSRCCGRAAFVMAAVSAGDRKSVV